MPVLYVDLPRDRTKTGSIVLEDDLGRVLAGPFACYGKADDKEAGLQGNPKRDPRRPFGDTPYGTYSVTGFLPSGDGTTLTARQYGPAGVIVLKPESGDAFEAYLNGRNGLLIHGGDPSPSGGLKATFGCIRLANDDMQAMMQVLRNVGVKPAVCHCLKVQVARAVTVARALDNNAGDAEPADPPTVLQWGADTPTPTPWPLGAPEWQLGEIRRVAQLMCSSGVFASDWFAVLSQIEHWSSWFGRGPEMAQEFVDGSKEADSCAREIVLWLLQLHGDLRWGIFKGVEALLERRTLQTKNQDLEAERLRLDSLRSRLESANAVLDAEKAALVAEKNRLDADLAAAREELAARSSSSATSPAGMAMPPSQPLPYRNLIGDDQEDPMDTEEV